MNRMTRRISVLIPIVLLMPSLAPAADLVMTTGSEKISEYVSDVPCVSLEEGAAVELFLDESGDVFRVYDASGVSYRASSLQEATDGYLRMRNVCVIREIEVRGYARISPEAIRFRIKTAPGDILHRQAVRRDIEEIYSMGYFETVDAGIENDVLAFTVKEYPVIVSIEVEGNDQIKDEDILESIGMKRFDILNTRILKTSIDRIIALYREKGYYNVEVDSSTKATEGGIALVFTVEENNRLYVKKVSFDGNENVSDRKLRGVMETKNRWVLGLFGHSGSYLEESLDTDLLRIEQYYGDQGYVRARAGRPQVEVREDKGIYITIPIDEGPLFYIGQIDVSGELIKPKEDLMEPLQIKSGDRMSKSKIQQSVEQIRNIYMNQGFAYVQVRPDMKENPDNTVDMNFVIKKGEPVHIDTIHIRGNTKTRDKVIRRELKFNEGDLFSSTQIQKSRDSLSRLGYFSNVNIESIPKDEDTLSMLVDVEETTTGAFSFGLAYSSVDKLLGTLQLSENNLMGLGLKTKFSVEYGGRKQSYTVDLEEPWLFDYPVSLGVRLFNTEREYTYYTKEYRGGNLRLSYPVFEDVRHSIIYAYTDVVGLEDIDVSYRDVLTEEEINGYAISSVTNTLYRDTTNDYFRPTRGSDAAFSVEYAGLGGDYHFTRTTARYAQFFPLYKDKLALMFKVRWGTINPAKGDDLPEDELFTLGGLNSIRGFKYGEIGPRDSAGNVIGGQRMFVFNTEITFPFWEVPGLYGVIFFDQGNAYDRRIDLSNLKRSYGAGIRWVTPMGPLRLEYGKVIDPEDFESNSRWDFSIGTFF